MKLIIKLETILKHINRNKQEQSIAQKQKQNQKMKTKINDKNWIGQLQGKNIVQSRMQTPKNIIQSDAKTLEKQSKLSLISKKSGQSPRGKLSSRFQQSYSQQKTPTQLMNDIFRSIGLNHMSNSKTFYSKQSQEQLGELLSNQNKLNSFIKKLSNEMHDSPPQVEKNYEILLTLLQQLNEADMQIHQDENGIKICFNRSQLLQKQRQIQRLEKQLEEKNKQTEKIVEEYEGVIRNFNDVIQKLIHQKKY